MGNYKEVIWYLDMMWAPFIMATEIILTSGPKNLRKKLKLSKI